MARLVYQNVFLMRRTEVGTTFGGFSEVSEIGT